MVEKSEADGMLRAVMLAHGIDVAALAERCGVGVTYLAEQLRFGVPKKRLRAGIEAALEYQHAVWSDPALLASRADVAKRFGVDPSVATIDQLRTFLASQGLPASKLSKARLERKIFELAAANPKMFPNTQRNQ